MILGFVTFFAIADKLGGPSAATELVRQHNPAKLKCSVSDADTAQYEANLASWEADKKKAIIKPKKPHSIPKQCLEHHRKIRK